MSEIRYRRVAAADAKAVYEVFLRALADLLQRANLPSDLDADNPDDLKKGWERRALLMQHLIASGDESWLAERNGQVIGYARSIRRDDVRELTEFFVLPGQQSVGIGGELFRRAFPADADLRNRIIIATSDPRALSFYLRAGVYPRFNICEFVKDPEEIPMESDLSIEAIEPTEATFAILNRIDREIIGYARQADHRWLLSEPKREGVLFLRSGQPVGYAYVGAENGPIALQNPDDFPAVLAYAETQAAQHEGQIHLNVPLINEAAIRCLFARNYQIDSAFFTFFMTASPLGKYEQYIVTSPELIV